MHIECTDKRGEPFIIRDATADDAVAFMQHIREISAEPNRLVGFPDERAQDEETQGKILQEIVDDPGHLFAFAMMGGELIGTIELQWKVGRRRMAHVASIGVTVSAGCRRRGIGRMLIETIIQQAEERGLRKIKLEVFAQNQGPILLYQQLGFRNVGRLRDEVMRNDGTYDDVIIMERFL